MADNTLLRHPVLSVPTADDLICAALRGENPALPPRTDAAAELCKRAALHGVQALLHNRLASSGWPDPILRELRQTAVQGAMWELRHHQILVETLNALEAAGVQPVLLKGTALAYSLYADAALRARADTDLIIPPDAKERVHRALSALGFEQSIGVGGQLASYQANYTLPTPEGGSHTLDLHWKINNSELLSKLFSYDELHRDAQRLPQLCACALGTSRVHALLLACMHRSTHKQNPYHVNGTAHHEADRLIWLYDIHLLASCFTAREWSEFTRLAAAKQLRAVCLEGIGRARLCFGTSCPEGVAAALGGKGPPEPPASYLNGSKLRQQWMDFRALGALPRQLAWLREVLLPSPAYMHHKYPEQRLRWLPWLYLRRAFSGFAKRLGWSRVSR